MDDKVGSGPVGLRSAFPQEPRASLSAQPDSGEQLRCMLSGKSADIQAVLLRAGMTAASAMPTARLVFRSEVRTICEGNACGSYNSCWACPPAVGTLEECRDRCLAFDTIQVFSRVYPLEDSFDFAGMQEAMADFKNRTIEAVPDLRALAGSCLVLDNEGCGICAQCTWPDAPCRFPDKCLHSIEGYGFTVSELAEEVGIPYNNGPCTVTFFGAVLYDDSGSSQIV